MKQISNGFWLPDTDTFFVNRPDYEHADYAISKPYWKSQTVALDIGAHCGFWSTRLCADFAHVESFEPVPEHAECLQANTREHTNIRIHNVACGNQTGNLYMERYLDNTGMSRIVDHHTNLSVPCVRLDDYFGVTLPVDFIKIDAENTELNVIQGAEQIICTHSPNLFVEILSPADTAVPTLLAEWGYSCVKRYERNYIFVRS